MGKHSKKKSKKNHKHKKKHKKKYSSESDTSSGEETKAKNQRKVRQESTSETSSDDCSKDSNPKFVEKVSKEKQERDEWMSFTSITTFTHDKYSERKLQRSLDKEAAKYNPKENSRELNPYWKDGGDGLPKFPTKPAFKKPDFDSSSSHYPESRNSSWKSSQSSNFSSRSRNEGGSWRKNKVPTHEKPEDSKNTDYFTKSSKSTDSFTKSTASDLEEKQISGDKLTSENVNKIAAKLVKAEIMGDADLIKELKEKLEQARSTSQSHTSNENILLMQTSSKGISRPLKIENDMSDPRNKRKNKRTETHDAGKRVRYYPDDDKYSLGQMFEQEKFADPAAEQAEFVRMMARAGRRDDEDDIFVDRASRSSNRRDEERALQRAVREAHSSDDCVRCLDSGRMSTHLVVATGKLMWLAVPSTEPLADFHCLLSPIRHTPCTTRLDEDEWEELNQFRKALVRMHASRGFGLIFFESEGLPRSGKHMVLECVALPKELADDAPMYFRKAIDECEEEWAMNKKLVNLSGRDVRKAVPASLPYFWVAFDSYEGFAHVIEDRRMFPGNFAKEIIAGMLDINHTRWRKPSVQSFDKQKERVVALTKLWSKFDFTK